MDIAENLEIHFHQQEQASVFLESNCSGDGERLGEVSLMTFFTIRMLSKLNVNETSDQLASLLVGAEEVMDALASGETTGGLDLIPYPGYAGRKRFLAKLRMSDNVRFDLKPKGFGILSSGVGYYAPVAVFALLRYLATKRADDSRFLQSLATASVMCGRTHLTRQITVFNHVQLAFPIIMSTCDQYVGNVE